MKTPLERARSARRSAARIALPEATDERVLTAALAAAEEGWCDPLLVGDRGRLNAALATAANARELEIADPAADPPRPELESLLTERLLLRSRPGGEAGELLARPSVHAGLLVAAGVADGAVMGAVATTAETVRAALLTVGLAPGISLLSSCFLMVWPDGKALIYSDAGVVPSPDEEGLADIAVAAATSARLLLGEEPRVALLSFSTHGSARHPMVDRVRGAVAELRRRGVEFAVAGELQADAALDEDVARRKAADSEVAGRANVLIFPDLQAGNIAYKLTQRLAGARAIGPLLQGLAAPLHDLSRGCSTEDVLEVLAVTALDAWRRQEAGEESSR